MSTPIIDMHVHVGLVGNKWSDWGYMSCGYIKSPVFKAFQLFARVKNHEINDVDLHRKACEAICKAQNVNRVVCLALAPVYDTEGKERKERSKMWVSNDYIRMVCRHTGEKALFGASVHPYDPEFKTKVQECIDQGAVLLKWLPSAQHINLAHPKVKEALKFLATTKVGTTQKPLPLLLHVGAEYAIPTTDAKTKSYDYLSWSTQDTFLNMLRFGKHKWHTPDIAGIHATIRAGVEAGAVIIMAHCGLPYIAANILTRFAEHSDFEVVKKFVEEFKDSDKGAVYADVSALCTPMRKLYFNEVRSLPPHRLLFGSDYPVPVFELSADAAEHWEDFQAITRGEIERIIIPEDNLLDVNERELRLAFGNAPFFSNFSALLGIPFLPPAPNPACNTIMGEEALQRVEEFRRQLAAERI